MFSVNYQVEVASVPKPKQAVGKKETTKTKQNLYISCFSLPTFVMHLQAAWQPACTPADQQISTMPTNIQ